MASANNEVIELLSSEDDDEVQLVSVSKPDSTFKLDPTTASKPNQITTRIIGFRKRKTEHLRSEEASIKKRQHTDEVTSTQPIMIDNDTATITTGIMELMDKIKDSSKAKTCTELATNTTTPRSTVQHIQQNDRWSCGFRNTQMMLTAVMPHLDPNHSLFQKLPRRLDRIAIPSTLQIQQTLEDAWKEGYDPRGARHYCYKIKGKNSKIGAVEVSSVFTYWGLDSSVIQFAVCSTSRESFPTFVQSYFNKALGKNGCCFCRGRTIQSHTLAKQLLGYAKSGLNLQDKCDCPILPLYFQWEGHSISIVGIDHDGHFLVLDPLKDGEKLKQFLCQSLTPVRLDPSTKTSNDSQIVLCTLESLAVSQKEARRLEPVVVTAEEEDVKQAVAARNLQD